MIKKSSTGTSNKAATSEHKIALKNSLLKKKAKNGGSSFSLKVQNSFYKFKHFNATNKKDLKSKTYGIQKKFELSIYIKKHLKNVKCRRPKWKKRLINKRSKIRRFGMRSFFWYFRKLFRLNLFFPLFLFKRNLRNLITLKYNNKFKAIYGKWIEGVKRDRFIVLKQVYLNNLKIQLITKRLHWMSKRHKSFVHQQLYLIKLKKYLKYQKFKVLVFDDSIISYKFKRPMGKNLYHWRRSPASFRRRIKKLYLKLGKHRKLRHYYRRYRRTSLLRVKRYYRFLRTKKTLFSADRKMMSVHLHFKDKFHHQRMPLHKKFRLNYYFPKFANFKFLYKNQIREQHTVRWLYKMTFKQLVKMFKKVMHFTKNKFEYAFFKYLEFRLDMCLYRLNMVFSTKQARQWIKRQLFLVNNKETNWPKYQINIGDVLVPVPYLRLQFTNNNLTYNDGGYLYNSLRLYWRPLQKDQYSNYMLINERIPAGLIFLNPQVNNVYTIKPWNIQFLTLSLLKYS